MSEKSRSEVSSSPIPRTILSSEQREQILKDREKHQRWARKVMKGKKLTSEIPVKSTTGEAFIMKVRALGEGEVADILEEANVSLEDLMNEKEVLKNMRVQRMMIAKAIIDEDGKEWTPDEIDESLAFGESTAPALLVCKLTGLIGATQEEMDKFRKEQISVPHSNSN